MDRIPDAAPNVKKMVSWTVIHRMGQRGNKTLSFPSSFRGFRKKMLHEDTILFLYDRSFISHTKKVIEPKFCGFKIQLKTPFFLKTQGLFPKLNDMFPKLKDFFFQNSTILKKKLKEFAPKLKLPELLSTSGYGKILQKKPELSL